MKKSRKTRLSFDFYNKECTDLAVSLLGKVLCRKVSDTVISGYIVETEAYVGFPILIKAPIAIMEGLCTFLNY